MNQPELALGDSGETVVELQFRLHALGLYHGAMDGHFGAQTAETVTRFQTDKGLTADGRVGDRTWEAIAAAEASAGIHAHPAAAAPPGHPKVGDLSEDQRWRWDGDQWQAAQPHLAAVSDDHSARHVSKDGEWLWDGTKWERVT